MIKKIQELSFIVAGALISVFAGLFFVNPKPCLWIIILLILSLILLAIGATNIESKMLLLTKCCRKKSKYLKIGILSDMDDIGWGNIVNKFIWLKYSSNDWLTSINDKNKLYKAELITSKSKFHKFHIIINPYGGVYPEEDLKNSITLKKIFDYVNNGGVFLNCADMPGFWAYNSLLKKEINLSRKIYTTINGGIQQLSLISNTPFNDYIDISVYNSEANNSSYQQLSEASLDGIKINRVASIESNIIPIIKLKIDGKLFTPLFTINYGEGHFIISLFWFDSSNSSLLDNLKEVIINCLASLKK